MKSQQTFLWYFLVLILSSCYSSRFSINQYCKVCLDTEMNILLAVYDEALNNSQNETLRNNIIREFKKNGFDKVVDVEELDYEFLKLGIKNIHSKEDLLKIHELGYPFLLKIKTKGLKEAEGYDLVDPRSSNYPIPRHQMINQSIQTFEMVETVSADIVYQLKVVTKDREYSRSRSDGQTEFYNYGNSISALLSSSWKGTKYTIADCSCPKGKYIRKSKFWSKF